MLAPSSYCYCHNSAPSESSGFAASDKSTHHYNHNNSHRYSYKMANSMRQLVSLFSAELLGTFLLVVSVLL